VERKETKTKQNEWLQLQWLTNHNIYHVYTVNYQPLQHNGNFRHLLVAQLNISSICMFIITYDGKFHVS